MTTYVVPFVIGILLARDSIVGIQYLVQSRYRQVSLLVLHHLTTNLLVTMLGRLSDEYYREGPEIHLRYTE